MKLIQINTWQGRIAPKLLQFLAEEKPDFITTQELYNSENDTPVSNGEFNLGAKIREITGLSHTFFSPIATIDIAKEERPYGNMIFSRWPIITQKTVQTFGKPIRHIGKRDPNCNISINLQIAEIEIDGKTLALANHHGYIARGTGERFGDKVSLRSMMKVARNLRPFANEPLILAGDMNVVSRSATMRVFHRFLRDLTAENHIKTTLSPLHRFQKVAVACDHILVNSQVEVKNFAVRENELISDHLPLVLEFEIK